MRESLRNTIRDEYAGRRIRKHRFRRSCCMPNVPKPGFSTVSRYNHTLHRGRNIGIRHRTLAEVEILKDGSQMPSGFGDVFRHVGQRRCVPQSLDDLFQLELQGDESRFNRRRTNQFGSRQLSQPANVADITSIVDRRAPEELSTWQHASSGKPKQTTAQHNHCHGLEFISGLSWMGCKAAV